MLSRLHFRCTLRTLSQTACSRRTLSTLPAELGRPVQSYISTSRDPYLNLSIEHYLLQKTDPQSAVLFLYINRPCVVLGRNQNPWLEVNLSLLKAAGEEEGDEANLETQPPGLGNVDLVRRRSGGGTVFHDEGNVNWTVISPAASFTRDKHAEMVVRALRTCGIQRSRVNERHDIVLDQGRSRFEGTWGPGEDMYSTPWQTKSPGGQKPLKVSGSAYKLTRGRALHHGTCLVSSPNLNIIPHYLRSPAKQFIKGRGVESVSSPVGNILLDSEEFIEATQNAFDQLYSKDGISAKPVGEEWLDVEEVKKGYDELTSADWTYLQTPQFTISNRPLGEDIEATRMSGSPFINLEVRHGAISETEISLTDVPSDFKHSLPQVLEGRNLHEVRDWQAVFNKGGLGTTQSDAFAEWLQDMLPVPAVAETKPQSRWKAHSLPSSVLQAIKSANAT